MYVCIKDMLTFSTKKKKIREKDMLLHPYSIVFSILLLSVYIDK